MVFLRSLSVALLLILASCWTPVYNQDLSVAALIRDKLRFDGETTSNINGNESSFYQAVRSYDSTVTAVVSSTQHSVSEFISGNFTELDFPLPDVSMVMVQPSLGTVGWLIPTLTNVTGGSGIIRRASTNPSQGSVNFPTLPAASPIDLIGFCTSIDANIVSSAFYLTRTTTAGVLTVTLSQDDSNNLQPSAPTALFSAAYPGASAGWMAVDMSVPAQPTVYLTHAPDSSGTYVTDVVDSSGLVTSWTGRAHVAAFLSTGRLLTREGSFYDVCDSVGKILYSFPAGTLQFAGEFVDAAGGTMRSRFSEALLIASNNGGQDHTRIRFYSIETGQLDKLK